MIEKGQAMDQFKEYLAQVFQGFRADPPDTPYQRGYLAAMLQVAGQINYCDDGDDLSDLEILI